MCSGFRCSLVFAEALSNLAGLSSLARSLNQGQSLRSELALLIAHRYVHSLLRFCLAFASSADFALHCHSWHRRCVLARLMTALDSKLILFAAHVV
jgi:hypothetical protein